MANGTAWWPAVFSVAQLVSGVTPSPAVAWVRRTLSPAVSGTWERGVASPLGTRWASCLFGDPLSGCRRAKRKDRAPAPRNPPRPPGAEMPGASVVATPPRTRPATGAGSAVALGVSSADLRIRVPRSGASLRLPRRGRQLGIQCHRFSIAMWSTWMHMSLHSRGRGICTCRLLPAA